MVKQGNLGFAPHQANFPEVGTDRNYLEDEEEESKDAMMMLQNQKQDNIRDQNNAMQNVNKKGLDGIKY